MAASKGEIDAEQESAKQGHDDKAMPKAKPAPKKRTHRGSVGQSKRRWQCWDLEAVVRPLRGAGMECSNFTTFLRPASHATKGHRMATCTTGSALLKRPGFGVVAKESTGSAAAGSALLKRPGIGMATESTGSAATAAAGTLPSSILS